MLPKPLLLLPPSGTILEVQQELLDVIADEGEELIKCSRPTETAKRFWNASKLERIEIKYDRMRGCVSKAG